MKGCADVLKIIGVPSEQEALTLYDEWKHERDEWNKEAKIHDAIFAWSVVIACILAIVGIAWSSGWSFETDTLGPWKIFGVSLIPVIGFFHHYGQLRWAMGI